MVTAAPLVLALLLPSSDGVPSSLAVAWVGEAKGPPRALVARFADLSDADAPPPRRYAYAAQLWRGEHTDKVLRFAEPAGAGQAAAARFEATPTLDNFPERATLSVRWRADERIELRLGDAQPWQLLTEPLVLVDPAGSAGAACQVTTARATLRGPGELRKGLALIEVCDGASPRVVLAAGAALLVDERGQASWLRADRAQVVALQPGSPPAAEGVAVQVHALEHRACQGGWTERVLRLVDATRTLTLEPSHGAFVDATVPVGDPRLACSALLTGLLLDDKGRMGRVDALVMAVQR